MALHPLQAAFQWVSPLPALPNVGWMASMIPTPSVPSVNLRDIPENGLEGMHRVDLVKALDTLTPISSKQLFASLRNLTKQHEVFQPKTILPGTVRHLLDLPYEVAIEVVDDQSYLTTGADVYIMGIIGWCPASEALLSTHLHTHPVGIRYPSLGDVSFQINRELMRLANRYSIELTSLLAHRGGITVYRAPQTARIQNFIAKAARWNLSHPTEAGSFSELLDADVLELTGKNWRGASDDEVDEITRQYVYASGMIVREVPWRDKAGIAALVQLLNPT